MKRYSALILLVYLSIIPYRSVSSHCEIPCGIYGDETRFELLEEHITTVEKSMKMIDKLSKEKKKNDNQLIRWVSNKEKHAEYIQEIAYQYFMTGLYGFNKLFSNQGYRFFKSGKFSKAFGMFAQSTVKHLQSSQGIGLLAGDSWSHNL